MVKSILNYSYITPDFLVFCMLREIYVQRESLAIPIRILMKVKAKFYIVIRADDSNKSLLTMISSTKSLK